MTRLRTLCKRIKPSVEIWQNCLQSYHPNHLDAGQRPNEPQRLALEIGRFARDQQGNNRH